MMTLCSRLSLVAMSLVLIGGLSCPVLAQNAPAAPAPNPNQNPNPTTSPDDAGPQVDNGPLVIKKKPQIDEEQTPPPAPAEPKIKNPNGETYSLRVDVPLVNLNVNVILDKTHQFVPGLKAGNFLVLEDGVEQKVQTVRIAQTPITAVLLLEFASTSYAYIRDMQNASASFYNTLRPDDYVAVITYDLRTHILTDFTNRKGVIADALNSLQIPGFSDTDMFDALYETLDRTTRIEGRKYVILIGSGKDSFSKLTWDKMMAKIKNTPNVTIFTIGTGALVNELRDAYGAQGPIERMDVLQAQNQLRTIAKMTGGLYFDPLFQGALPDVFAQINNSIRNQYALTYRPTNAKNDGSYRHIKVLLVDNEGKPLQMQDEKKHPLKYTVIARDGYKAKLPVE
jgi:VWFA-related protein